MIKLNTGYPGHHIFRDKVLENDEAFVAYLGDGEFIAVEKQLRGDEYGKYPQYYRSTTGDIKRCRKAFEKYSPKTMAALGLK